MQGRGGVSVAVLAGEMSGDMAGASLVRAIREQLPGATFWGLGSTRMAEAGVELLADCRTWGAIGVIESIKVLPRLRFQVYPTILKALHERKPDLLVPIDFGAFNMAVLHRARGDCGKVLYYYPPGSWRKSGPVGGDLVKLSDWIATPFPWSAERLRAAGADAEFVGHPLLDVVRPALSRAEFCSRMGLEEADPIVALLPGSRSQEVTHNLPTMVEAASLLHSDMPRAQFVLALAPSVPAAGVEAFVAARLGLETGGPRRAPFDPVAMARDLARRLQVAAPPPVVAGAGVAAGMAPADGEQSRRRFLERLRARPATPLFVVAQGMTYDALGHADAAIVCSGTATLEAAILGTPMVIIYRGSRISELEYHLRRAARIEHIGMPNIIAGRRIVPEYLQHDASPTVLCDEMGRLVTDPSAHTAMKQDLAAVRAELGEPGGTRRVAARAVEMIAGIRPAQG